jgi:hypothetical protein
MDGDGRISYPCLVKDGPTDPAWLAAEAQLIKLQLKAATEEMPAPSPGGDGSATYASIARALGAQPRGRPAQKRRRINACARI